MPLLITIGAFNGRTVGAVPLAVYPPLLVRETVDCRLYRRSVGAVKLAIYVPELCTVVPLSVKVPAVFRAVGALDGRTIDAVPLALNVP